MIIVGLLVAFLVAIFGLVYATSTSAEDGEESEIGIGAGAPPAVSALAYEIELQADFYGLDPDLVAAVIWQESAGNPDAIGAAGEIGLMQVTRIAARDVGMESTWERGTALRPVEQIELGCAYLEKCKNEYTDGSQFRTLRCYNEGPPPFNAPASLAYAEKVLAKKSAIARG